MTEPPLLCTRINHISASDVLPQEEQNSSRKKGKNLSNVEDVLSAPYPLPASSPRRSPAEVAHSLGEITQKHCGSATATGMTSSLSWLSFALNTCNCGVGSGLGRIWERRDVLGSAMSPRVAFASLLKSRNPICASESPSAKRGGFFLASRRSLWRLLYKHSQIHGKGSTEKRKALLRH